jgi:hypothetical protein
MQHICSETVRRPDRVAISLSPTHSVMHFRAFIAGCLAVMTPPGGSRRSVTTQRPRDAARTAAGGTRNVRFGRPHDPGTTPTTGGRTTAGRITATTAATTPAGRHAAAQPDHEEFPCAGH